MGKKKSASGSKSPSQTHLKPATSYKSENNSTPSTENVKEGQRNNKKKKTETGSGNAKLFVFGFFTALILSIAVIGYQNFNSTDITDAIHRNFDDYLGKERLDAVLSYLFTQNVVHEQERDASKTGAEKNAAGGDGTTHKTEDEPMTPKTSKVASDDDGKAKDEHPQSPSKAKYQKAHITNKLDNRIRSDLDQADSTLDKGKIQEAIKLYDSILSRYPDSPRAVYGKGRALNKLAEQKMSNSILEESIAQLLKVLSLPDLPKALAIEAGKTCAERQSFRGWGSRAVKTMRELANLYPEEKELWNDLGVKCLLINRIEDARQAFIRVLEMDATDGFAKVHLGFIIKTSDRKYEESIPYLRQGIATNAPGVIDGRFFFHLGDALFRVGRPNESYDVYQMGADKGVFRSVYQRSLYNVDGLTGRPWWTKAQTGNAKFLSKLEENWKVIRDEGLANLDEDKGVFELEAEDLREEGDWRQFTLYSQGRKNEQNCQRAPRTCALFDGFTESTGCKRGQIKFSVMHPGVHVWPHCGPTNCRIRAHLGLVIPEGPRIRVASETRTWKLGKVIIFDDSFEHEVWHNGTSLRLVLILDMWHPELTAHHKNTLSAI